MPVTRDCKVKLLSVILDPSKGDYLLYELTVWGAQGIFDLVDENDQVVMSHKHWPTPQQNYQRKWPQDPSELPSDKETTHTMGLHFLFATKYAYRLTLRSSNGNVLKTIKECTYESANSHDSFFEPVHISIP
jgi:hypothetical protein